MNLSSMDYFTVLARERSFTKAAQQLHITQQSLSAHIAALEQELGTPLVVRKVPLELTYAGTVFLRYANDIQHDLNTMRQEFCDITRNQRGLLRIGVALTRGHTILPPLVCAFQQQYPNISIELTEGANETLYRKLLNGETDLAIANFSPGLPGIELRDFHSEEVVLLISRTLLSKLYGNRTDTILAQLDRGDLSALNRCPFLKGNPGDISSHIGQSVLQAASLRPEISAASGNMETLLSLCALGAGACFCPESIARAALSPEQMESLHIIRLGAQARYTIRFGHLKQSYQWNILSEFMRIALENFPLREL